MTDSRLGYTVYQEEDTVGVLSGSGFSVFNTLIKAWENFPSATEVVISDRCLHVNDANSHQLAYYSEGQWNRVLEFTKEQP